MGIKGSVTIQHNPDGTWTLIPPIGVLDRNIQFMQWSLDAPERFSFAANPIVFQTDNLPPGYRVWSPPGETPDRVTNWQVRAKANLQVKKGDPPVWYRYDIYVDEAITAPDGSRRVKTRRLSLLHPATLEKIDPDMENQPQP